MLSLLLMLAPPVYVANDHAPRPVPTTVVDMDCTDAAGSAQERAACPCKPTYPPSLAGWRTVHPLGNGIVVGRAVQLAPVPVANIRLAVQPSRPLSGTHLASASFVVKEAGTYSVAAGGAVVPVRPLWLDIAGADGKPLVSTAHGHGAACTSITKVVEFRLAPGRYTLLATGLTSAAPVRVLIVRKS